MLPKMTELKEQEITHILKTWPIFFQAIKRGTKTAEIRKNDRDFQVGDRIILKEWEPTTEKYTGEFVEVTITHILQDTSIGLQDGYCLLSFIPSGYIKRPELELIDDDSIFEIYKRRNRFSTDQRWITKVAQAQLEADRKKVEG